MQAMRDDLSPDAAAELRLLRAEVAALRRHVAVLRPPSRHGWLKHVIRGLEDDPHVQYRVHLYGAVYWLANFPLVTCLFFFAPGLWLKLGIFITLVYSIYANLATDYGSMSAAMAAFGQSPLPEIPVQDHVELSIPAELRSPCYSFRQLPGEGRQVMTMRRFEVFRPEPPAEYRDQGAANAPDEVQFEGVVFTDGTVAVRWLTEFRSHSIWASLADLEKIHGHPEYGTQWRWLDS